MMSPRRVAVAMALASVLSICGARSGEYVLTLTPGWNLISVAGVLQNGSVEHVFAEHMADILEPVWTWGEDHCYERATELLPLRGYWVYSKAEQAFAVQIGETPPRLTVCPEGGDPSAQEWQVVNARWVRNYYVNGGVTMNDQQTGLMWVYDAAMMGQATQSSADSWCDVLDYAGYKNTFTWELPRAWELPSKMQFADLLSETAHFARVVSAEPGYWTDTSSGTGYYYATMGDEAGFAISASSSALRWVWPCRQWRADRSLDGAREESPR